MDIQGGGHPTWVCPTHPPVRGGRNALLPTSWPLPPLGWRDGYGPETASGQLPFEGRLPVYLRRVQNGSLHHYVLRESFLQGDCWRHRDLIDIGFDPSSWIVYPGGNGFYFEPLLHERLDEMGAVYDEEQLEEAFFPFLAPHLQRVLHQFSRRAPSRARPPKAPSREEQIQRMHQFDKRRVHYLRCGRMDMGNLDAGPLKFLSILVDKSRDEVEHTIEGMERALRPHETRNYLYAALHLDLYFAGSLLRHHPLALDPEKVDQFFIDELCALNDDRAFFRGVDRDDSNHLHEYLKRYAILYFDAPAAARMEFGDFSRFFRNRRQSPSPVPSRTLSTDEALARFDLTRREFENMTQEDLARLYRRKAKDAHPDCGGRHDDFLDLTDAYEALRHRM